jgi:predicted helicase
MKFTDIIDTYRKQSFSERDKGTRFERLIKGYLQTDPLYADKFSEVWMWEDFPYRDNLGGVDTGIDLVTLTNENEYWAIQCKCFDDKTVVEKAHIDTFLSTSARRFGDNNELSFAVRCLISSNNNFSRNAEESLNAQTPPVLLITKVELEKSPVDWQKLDGGMLGSKALSPKFSLKPHQERAVNKAYEYFKHSERGKLIMACGTGKTFTSLKIAEKETNGKGNILFLAPSLALVGQTLREWTSQSDFTINPICVCSDVSISIQKKKSDDSIVDDIKYLGFPATTDSTKIKSRVKENGFNVIFSTYQSIQAVIDTKLEFDLIICDEAHRTTGYKEKDKAEVLFTKVHNNANIKSKRRLYMTATPRIYKENVKEKATLEEITLFSMDDPNIYGYEIDKISFAEAVEKDLLSDYRVLIMTMTKDSVAEDIQKAIAQEIQKAIDEEKRKSTTEKIKQELDKKDIKFEIDDTAKVVGAINALLKKTTDTDDDPAPMKKGVVFSATVDNSKFAVKTAFNVVARAIGKPIISEHVDGSMNGSVREKRMEWLKEATNNEETRLLTNVRCLSEGVDVPSLDAVVFMSTRKSIIDVVQSVGRVMRKAEGKKYGYVIIPVFVDSDDNPDIVTEKHEEYSVVWEVLSALRAHDERLEDEINKINLNKYKGSKRIQVIAPPQYNLEDFIDAEKAKTLQNAIYARLVRKFARKDYWKKWAKSVANIAERLTNKITSIATQNPEPFEKFLHGLKQNINNNLSMSDAIEMISQHIITKPVFNALFDGYTFAERNAVSIAMQSLLDTVDIYENEEDREQLESFYKSVASRAKDIKDAEGKQTVIVELYNSFFNEAFPKMAERLGIVYTPVEVVDFIIHSVDKALQREFNVGLTDKNVTVLDPFTGTGTFIVRLLQSKLIKPEDLKRKYKDEIFANEIVLLAYYIAAVNIENAYHDVVGDKEYEPFEGICLTDTFNLDPKREYELDNGEWKGNSERIKRQNSKEVTVIIGNPPYSAGQRSANDNAQNEDYPELDRKIETTYVANSTATNKNSLYDSYIRAFKWSEERIGNNNGIICFVSNGGWLDGNAADGFRKCLETSYNKCYVYNLRGNQRTSGELSRKEGGKIFGSGSRTPVTITLLVKKHSD